MTEYELIEKMLEAYFKTINRTFSGGQRDVVIKNMRAALAVARPAILEEAAKVLEGHANKFYDHAKAPYRECAVLVRSLAKPDSSND